MLRVQPYSQLNNNEPLDDQKHHPKFPHSHSLEVIRVFLFNALKQKNLIDHPLLLFLVPPPLFQLT